MIQEYNFLRNIVFPRLLLSPDPYSKAFQDNHYKSAFTDSPTEMWPGEPGVVIVRPSLNRPTKPTAELQKTWDDFGALQKLWFAYEGSCSQEKCPICQSDSDGKQVKEDDSDDRDDMDDEEDDDENEEDGKEDEEGDEDIGSSRKDGKRISKRQPNSTGHQPPIQNSHTKKSSQTNKHRKKAKTRERDWSKSAPYDESVPITHRYGYTWAGSTSNELMSLWQAYRKSVVD